MLLLKAFSSLYHLHVQLTSPVLITHFLRPWHEEARARVFPQNQQLPMLFLFLIPLFYMPRAEDLVLFDLLQFFQRKEYVSFFALLIVLEDLYHLELPQLLLSDCTRQLFFVSLGKL